jgi:hypothetical protein
MMPAEVICMAMPDSVGPTDMAAPRPPLPPTMLVKVHTDGMHARISMMDGSVKMIVPAGMVLKRMRPGEEIAFFRATAEPGTEVVELGDRVDLAAIGKESW